MIKKKDRTDIVYIPYPEKGAKTNAYTSNMVKILQSKYYVTGCLARPTDVSLMLKTKAVFLNWVEVRLDRKMKQQIILYKLLGTKIIWVFHNKYPHEVEPNSNSIKNMNWLARNSDVIILHSKCSGKYIPDASHNRKKAVYVPHILYDDNNKNLDLDIIRLKYGISKEDFVFTIFGSVKPYKNIEEGIEVFKKLGLPNSKLLITGHPSDGKYAKKISSLCKNENNIILDLQYLSNDALDGIIDVSDIILMPYKDGSSMNSGVLIQAFSRGKTVIAPDICMAREMAVNRFLYIYRNSLEKAMLKAYTNGKAINQEMGKCAQKFIYKNNNEDIVKKSIFEIL